MPMTGFVCQDTYLSKLAKLSDQEVGRLMRALMMYHASGELQELTGRESVAFDFIRDDIDRAEAAYQEKCEKNRANRTGANDRQRSSTTVNDCQPGTTNDHQEKEKEKEKPAYRDPADVPSDINTHTNQTATGRRARARAWFDPEHPDAGDDEAWRTGDRARSAIAQRIAAWAISTLQLRQRHVVTEAGTVGENIHSTLCEAMRCGISPAQCVELARQTEVLWEWELLLKADTIGQGGGSPEWRDQVEELREEIFRIRGAA